MRKKAFIQILIWCGYFISGQELLAQTWYYVRWMDDGDSIVLQDGRHVRYIGINTPEIQYKKKWAAFWAGYAPAKRCVKQWWSY